MSRPRSRFATRLNSFLPHGRSEEQVAAALRAVAAVDGIGAVELNFPQHVRHATDDGLICAAHELGLEVTALNLRYDDARFAAGAFTHPDERVRQEAFGRTLEAVELAGRTGVGHVILWMGPDGTDYPFQASFAQLWSLEIAGFRAVVEQAPGLLVSVEYKPSDPRRRSLIRSMGDALLAVHEVGLPNFGVTLDFCHALMAGEEPAAAAVQALRLGRLFGVHLNDGYGPADDGLMVGSVHLWQTLELLLELRRAEFDGTIYFDTFPERVDPAAECAANVRMVERLEAVLDRIDEDALWSLQSEQRAVEATALIRSALLRHGDA